MSRGKADMALLAVLAVRGDGQEEAVEVFPAAAKAQEEELPVDMLRVLPTEVSEGYKVL